MNAYIVKLLSPHREEHRLFANSAFNACVEALKAEKLPTWNTSWYFVGKQEYGIMGSAHGSIQLTVENWYKTADTNEKKVRR